MEPPAKVQKLACLSCSTATADTKLAMPAAAARAAAELPLWSLREAAPAVGETVILLTPPLHSC